MKDKEVIREAINALYKGAGIHTSFDGEVNEKVAHVFGQLLSDINSCSMAFKWVPRPTVTGASISWLAKNLTRSIIDSFRDTQSFTCTRVKILQYKTPLELASIGL